MEILNDRTSKALQIALDALSLRQQVASNNLANVDTPGFKAGKVTFEARLQAALKNGGAASLVARDPRRFSFADDVFREPMIQVSPATNTTARADGNNVDIDREMADLAETNLNYNALASLMGSRIALFKTIISGGMR